MAAKYRPELTILVQNNLLRHNRRLSHRHQQGSLACNSHAGRRGGLSPFRRLPIRRLSIRRLVNYWVTPTVRSLCGHYVVFTQPLCITFRYVHTGPRSDSVTHFRTTFSTILRLTKGRRPGLERPSPRSLGLPRAEGPV